MERSKTLVIRAYLTDNQIGMILFINNNAIAERVPEAASPAKLLDLDRIFQTF